MNSLLSYVGLFGSGPLTLFGFIAVTAMLIAYALEDRSPWFVLVFAVCCLAASGYGFALGSWPFGILEIVWCLVALWRWRRLRAAGRRAETTTLT